MIGGAAALGLGLASCLGLAPYACQQDSQCRLDGRQGWCEAEGYCSLPDTGCDGGRRFSEHAPAEYSEACVDAAGSGSGSGSTGTTQGGSDVGDTETACVAEDCGCAEQLFVGTWHGCATTTQGDLRCWGSNDDGRLGLSPNPIAMATPVPLDGTATHVDIESHGCAVVDGGVRCWGPNIQGRVSPAEQLDAVLAPVAPQFAQLMDIDRVGVASAFSCAQRPDLLFCWGDLDSSFGLDPSSAALNIAPLGGLSSMALAQRTLCALASDGRVWCAGSDLRGELGLGDAAADASQLVLAVPTTGHQGLVASDRHFCAWQGSTVRCWGDNQSRQTGSAQMNGQTIEAPLEMGFEVMAVRTNQHTSCALGPGNLLSCWGQRVPDGSEEGEPSPVVEPSPLLSTLDPVVDVGLGSEHGCALTDAGQVWCWGRNGVGQQGIPGSTSVSPQRVDLGC